MEFFAKPLYYIQFNEFNELAEIFIYRPKFFLKREMSQHFISRLTYSVSTVSPFLVLL